MKKSYTPVPAPELPGRIIALRDRQAKAAADAEFYKETPTMGLESRQMARARGLKRDKKFQRQAEARDRAIALGEHRDRRRAAKAGNPPAEA